MYLKDNKRFNPNATYIIDGVTYNGNILDFPQVAADYGITEVPNPETPQEVLDNPDHYFVTEQDESPYIAVTKKSDEDIAQLYLKKYEQALDIHMDSVAREHRYDSRFTFALRAGYQSQFQEEGLAFAQWMDSCNVAAYTLMEEVKAGIKSMPKDEAEFLSILPVFEYVKAAV